MRRAILTITLAALLPATVSASGGTAPRWVVPIDSRTTDQWLSEDAGVVYGARDGRLVALDMRTGRVVWRAAVAPATKSAVAGNAVATPTANGVVFLRARDGAVVRRVRLQSSPNGMMQETTSPIVASASTGFVSVTKTPTGVEARGWTFDGRSRWTRHYRGAPFGTLLPLGGDAIGLTVPGSGDLLAIDGRDGRAVAATDGVDSLIGADGRYLWFNVVGGGIKGIDLDTNRSIALHGSIVRGAARVEHGIAVAVVDGRLTRLDLTTGTQQTLKVDGRWIGGPTDGRIFVERGDGVYVRGIAPAAKQRRVARYNGEARIVAADRNVGMIAMEDGRIFVVDVANARPLATIETPCTSYEGFAASDATTLVHCDTHGVSQLVAFDRYSDRTP
jgi:outer membrane protein assembly factor BamB